MELTLNHESEQIIQRKVDSGGYSTAEDVVSAALKLLEEQDESELSNLRDQVTIGIEEANHGDLLDGHEVFREARQRLNEKRSIS